MSDDLQVKLATCCRMMEWLGLINYSGHVSARLPDTDYIYINSYGKSRYSLSPEDIIKVDLQGRVVDKDARIPSETPLHTTIYQKRPDVQAIAHIHSPMVITLSIANKKIIPIVGSASGFPLSGVPVYDDSRLINTTERGEAVAKVLGQERAVILRAHGAAVVGESVEAVFFISYCLENNAQKLFAVYKIGQPQLLRSEEIEEGKKIYIPRIYNKAWSYYRDRAGISF